MEAKPAVFVTGATGYMGRALTARMAGTGVAVYGLARAGSAEKLAPGVVPVIGEALDPASYVRHVPEGATLIHLIGTPHPSPRKAREFRDVDLASIRSAVDAAKHARVAHLVYVSVAHPAPVMHAYVQARVEGEQIVRDSGIPATVLRPWYVLGPGHRWPLALVPLYALCDWLPGLRASARRLGLVTLEAMVRALEHACLHPPSRLRVMDVQDIRRCGEVLRRAAAVEAPSQRPRG